MDLYDRRILAVLRDGKPRNFRQILSEVEFSYNTLRLHLAQLVEQGLVVRRKRPQQGARAAWWFSPSMSCGVFAGMRKVDTARRSGVDVRPKAAPKS